MKTYNFTILKDKLKVAMVTNSLTVLYFIKYKDGNKLGLRRRTVNFKRLDASKIVLNENDAKKMYEFKIV